MAQEKIIIRFEPKGHKPLIDALNKLAKVQDKLENQLKQSTSASNKFAQSQHLVNHRMSSNTKGANIMAGAFATLRNKLLLASFATTIAAKPLFELIKAQSDAEEIANKFNVVFGNQANIVREWANALGTSVGRANSELEFMLSTLQDTFVPLGFSREAATLLSTSLTKLALDVASFNNKADADVIRDFQSALVGNHETVRKYGIVLTEASLKAEALSSGIISIERELTSSEKVQARLNILYAGSKDAIGDLDRTQDSFANTLKRFNAEVLLARQELGEKLMPVARDLLVVMSGLVNHFKDTAVIKGYATSLGAVAVGFTAAKINAYGFAASLTALKVALVKTGLGAAVVIVGELAARMLYGKTQNDEFAKSFADIDEKIKNMLGGEGGIDKLSSAELDLAGITEKLAKSRKEQSTILSDLEKAQKAYNNEAKKQEDNFIDKVIADLKRQRDELEKLIKAEERLTLANLKKNALFDNQITIQEKIMANDEKWSQVQDKLTAAENKKDVAGQAAAQEELNAVKQEGIALRLEEVDQETRMQILKENNKVLTGKQTELEAQQNIINAERNALEDKYFDILHSDDPNTRLEFKEKKYELDKRQNELDNATLKAQKELTRSIIESSFQQGKSYGNAAQAAEEAGRQIIASAIQKMIVNLMEDALAKFGWAGLLLAGTSGAVVGSLVGQLQKSVKFEQGGLVGGRRHSQGGTMIEAEQGEFVMRRDAVESIGIENLNRMNQGGGGAVTVNVSGNVLSKDFVEGELADQIKNAIRRGTDFGLS